MSRDTGTSTATTGVFKVHRRNPFLKGLALFVAVFATLFVCFHLEEDWRGRRAWEARKAELRAKGIQTEWRAPPKPPFPDEENFARTPFLVAVGVKGKVNDKVWRPFEARANFVAGIGLVGEPGKYQFNRPEELKENLEARRARFLLDGGKPPAAFPALPDTTLAPGEWVLQLLEQFAPEMDELLAAAKRPHAAFRLEGTEPFYLDIPNYPAARMICQLFAMHASAALASGHTEIAHADLRVIFRYCDALQVGDTLVGAMIRVMTTRLATGVFWEGLALQRWSEAHYVEFQRRFQEIHLVAEVDQAMRLGERLGVTTMTENAARTRTASRILSFSAGGQQHKVLDWLIPRGWVYQNILHYDVVIERMIESTYDPRKGRLLPPRDFVNVEALVSGRSPFHLLAGIAIPNFAKAGMRTATHQAGVDLALAACALERHRLAEGHYPATLEALAPRFLERVPLDARHGQPPLYELGPDGRVTLTALGWTKREGGEAGESLPELLGEVKFTWPAKPASASPKAP